MSLRRPLISLKSSVSGSKSTRFSVLTYNLLSPYYIWPEVYTYVPNEYKRWNYRHRLLENEILSLYRADILCLQELISLDYQHFWNKVLLKKFNYGSKYIAKPPPLYWERSLNEMDGVGVFYDLNKFEYISSAGIYLNDILDTFNLNELEYLDNKVLQLTDGSGNPVEKMKLLDVLKGRNQVCMFVSLKHRVTNTVLVVVNTHLYWKYDEVKLAQCLIIMRRLNKIIADLLIGLSERTYSKITIIFAGDMNSSRDSSVIKFLKGVPLSPKGLNLMNPVKAYLDRVLYDDVPRGSFVNTCYSGELKGIFDYICYHRESLVPRGVLGVSQDLEMEPDIKLPNASHPSDHIPMMMEFQLVERDSYTDVCAR